MLDTLRRTWGAYGWVAGWCLMLLACQPAHAQPSVPDATSASIEQADTSTTGRSHFGPHGPKLALHNVQSGDGFTAGLGFGPEQNRPRRFVDASVLLSNRLYWGTVATVGYALSRSLMTYGFGRYRHMPEEDFYGIGPETTLDDRTSYRLNEASGGALFGWTLAPRTLAGGYGYYQESWYGPGKDEDYPIASEFFSEAEVPGLGDDTRYAVAGVFFEWDLRDRIDPYKPAERFLPLDRIRGLSFNTRHGTYVMARAEHRAALDGKDFSYSFIEARAQQYLPLAGDVHSFALAQRAELTFTADEQEVPFYLMPVLGGSKTLRGFDGFRFRDRNMVVLNAEYRWQVIRPLDLVLLFDAGQVFSSLDAFNLRDMELSYGVAARLRTYIELPVIPYTLRFMKARAAFSREEVRLGVGLSAFM